jgi:nicotinate dehydrogenase subunit A
MPGGKPTAATIAFGLNGERVEIAASPEDNLLDILRNRLGLKGTRYGCGAEACGACMVLIDGAPRPACTAILADAAGRNIETVEGLAPTNHFSSLQQAFLDEQAGQCGYCLSGILISATALLRRNPDPSRAEILTALDAHLCRCGTHHRIVRAVLRAAAA